MSKLDITGRIHSVETFGSLDGPGIRYLLFLQGCPMRCIYCHNPDSWDLHSGTQMSVEEIMREISRYRNFIMTGGITLSGGEPLMQPEFCEAIISESQKRGFHVAVDTSGSMPLEECKEAVALADLLLLDIKALDEKLCKEMTGHSNRNPLAILDYREQINKPVWIRHVLVPGYTLDKDKLTNLAQYLSKYKCIERIELLPFHKMGEYKWEQLNLPYKLYDTPAPTRDEIDMAVSIMKKYNLPVK